VSTINTAPLTQEQLKVAGFCHQLDAEDRDDDNEGDNEVVDKDNNYLNKDNR
jgi:hypothetical protein